MSGSVAALLLSLAALAQTTTGVDNCVTARAEFEQDAKSSSNPELNWVPQCDNLGLYQPRQCQKTIGGGFMCWCVTPENGREIDGTRNTFQTESELDCTAKAKVDNCVTARAEFEQDAKSSSNPGLNWVPQCDNLGLYQPRQCQKTIGGGFMCWCVTPENGREIDGTRNTFGTESELDCSAKGKVDNCVTARAEFEKDAKNSPNPELNWVPQCDNLGMYQPRQCQKTIGGGFMCWCANPQNGREVDGTRNTFATESELNCDANGAVDNCFTAKAEFEKDAQSSSTPELNYVPQCESNGLYQAKQCQRTGGSGFMCWCVTPENGREIEGTRNTFKTDSELNCNGNSPATGNSCLDAKKAGEEEAKTAGPSHFIPDCEANGQWSTRQCQKVPAGGFSCWCVQPDGTDIEGTQKHVGNKQGFMCPAV